MAKADDTLPLLKGTLDLLILKALSWEPMHGYGISSWLGQQSESALEIDDSALYQALQRLESRAQVTGEWGTTENNRRARYYTLTTRGRQRLRADSATWIRYTTSVSSILARSHRSG